MAIQGLNEPIYKLKKLGSKSSKKPRVLRNNKDNFQTVDHSPLYSLENL